MFHCKTNVVRRLAGVGVDDFLGVHAEAEHGLHLDETGAIKASAQRSQSLENHGITVALDSVEGLDAGEGLAPGDMLAVDIADIEKVEGLLLGGGGGKDLESLADGGTDRDGGDSREGRDSSHSITRLTRSGDEGDSVLGGTDEGRGQQSLKHAARDSTARDLRTRRVRSRRARHA